MSRTDEPDPTLYPQHEITQTGKGASDDDLTFDSPNRWTKSDRPLSERVRETLMTAYDPFAERENAIHAEWADEIAALEAERDKAEGERNLLYTATEKAIYRLQDALAALEEGCDG
jgi:hypothetical protein